MKGRVRGRGRRVPRRRQRKARIPRRLATRNHEFAAMRQTLQLANDSSNTIYDLNVSLAQFDRAVQVARVYQYYRIKLVEYKFKPDSDTFAPGSATLPNGSIPYLYWLINKGDVLQISDFNAMRDSGAKPIRFDDKTITVRWKPNVLLGVNNTPSGTGSFAYNNGRQSPWLATNDGAGKGVSAWLPSTIPHFGLLYGVEQTTVQPDVTLGYGVEITVHFEFMKPMQFKGTTVDALPAVKKEVVPASKPVALEV